MKILEDISQLPPSLPYPVITIGNFDGLHLGHLEIFSRIRKLTEKNKGTSIAITLWPHPVRFVKGPEFLPFLLCTQSQKRTLIAAEQIDYLIEFKFDRQFANIDHTTFVKDILIRGISAKHILVGYDFNFGKGRKGSSKDLINIANNEGVIAHIVPAVNCYGDPISSTRIRKAVKNGNPVLARELLGRNFFIEGIVVSGDGRGRTLGFPTANIKPENELLPQNGVYAGIIRTNVLGRAPAVINIGSKPTFNSQQDKITIEAFIINFEKSKLDLYNQKVKLEFVERLRDERKFDSVEGLVNQIKSDVRVVRELMNVKN